MGHPTDLLAWSGALMLLAYSASGACEPTRPLTRDADAHAPQHSQPQQRPTLELGPWQLENLRRPNPGDIVEAPGPTGMAPERVSHDARVTVASGGAALVCPANVGCKSRAGAFVAVTALHRPEPWFAWGGLLEWQQVGQTWQQPQGSLSLTHHLFDLRGLAQVHPLAGERVDPYFGLGFGAGVIGSRAEGPSADETDTTGPAPATLTTWSPFYAVRAGIDVALGPRVSLGATLDWSNFQALTGDNCPWKAWGMCTSSSWGAFNADHAIWKVGAALSFAFGKEL